ncbi:MAG: cell division protein ZapB [Desulfovibrio sp.]|nr:cell division protein ZapB [Desulfovibrio sp.]
MEFLDQLETRLVDLLSRFDRVKNERNRLRAEVEALTARIAGLEERNRNLDAALAREENRRGEALKHIDALLHKIHEYDSVE